ncbi:acyltransferase [Niallia sp. Marseille-Q9988]
MLTKVINRIKLVIFRDLFINTIASSVLVPRTIRSQIYRIYGVEINTKYIQAKCFLGGNNIKIGRGTTVNYQCFFDNNGLIEIGENCDIAMQVSMITSTHEIGNSVRRAGQTYGKDIRIEDGCWIGARVIIQPGVTIGKGCVIAAGSVVTKNCSPNGLYAGVPAKRIRELN